MSFGELSVEEISVRGIVLRENAYSGRTSVEISVGKYLFGELPIQRNILRGAVRRENVFGELSVGEMSVEEKSIGEMSHR